ncbi:MAG: Rnf-Nqr domain containing protein [Oscillospiraceae bacterium]
MQLLENILKKFIPALYKALGVYLPLITTNCTILGVTISEHRQRLQLRGEHRVCCRRRPGLPGGHGSVLRRAPQGGGGCNPQVL